MSADIIQFAPPAASGPHGTDAQVYRQVLHDLITMGTDIAHLLHAQAVGQAAQQAIPQPAQAPQPPKNVHRVIAAPQAAAAPPALAPEVLIDITLAFDCIARAVRRSILLARTLDSPIRPASLQPDPAQHRAAARKSIIREVEDVIQRSGESPDLCTLLEAELRDRLDAPDLDEDIATRPAADIITEICRDLGLAQSPGGSRPWPRRTPDDARQLCAQAAAASAAHQPAAHQPGPQTLRCDAAPPGPHPDHPAARPRPKPSLIHPRNDLPEDPAEAIAMILGHAARTEGRWRPPTPD